MDAEKLINAIFIVMCVLGGTGIFCSVCGFIRREYLSAKERRSPVYEDTATVISKRISMESGGRGYTGAAHYATFETRSGFIVELRMGRSDYRNLNEGSAGRLVWQGKRLELFDQAE